MPNGDAMTTSSRDYRLPRWIWAAYLVLFALSVPWYLPEVDPMPIWFGLPYWVAICLAVCLAIACFTAWVIHRYWREGA